MTENAIKTIGLFGGSFNPPHVAHVLVVAWAFSVEPLDEIWAIPSGGHPFGKELAPFEHRLAMCGLAFAPFGDRVKVLDIEREPKVHYSVDTARALAERHPEHRWRWILGSDAMAERHQWRRFEELERIAPPLAVPRRGKSETETETPAFALPDINSTQIREALAGGGRRLDELKAIVPRAVLEYIERHGLYRA